MNENHVAGEIGCQHVQESDSEFWRVLTLLGLFFYCFQSDKDSCHLKDALGFNFNKLWYPVMKTGHELFFVSTKRNLHPEMLKSISRTESVSPGAKGRDHV